MRLCAVLEPFSVHGRTVGAGFVWAAERGSGWAVSFNGAEVIVPRQALTAARGRLMGDEEMVESARSDQYQEAPAGP